MIASAGASPFSGSRTIVGTSISPTAAAAASRRWPATTRKPSPSPAGATSSGCRMPCRRTDSTSWAWRFSSVVVLGLKPSSTSIAESGRLRGTPFASVTIDLLVLAPPDAGPSPPDRTPQACHRREGSVPRAAVGAPSRAVSATRGARPWSLRCSLGGGRAWRGSPRAPRRSSLWCARASRTCSTCCLTSGPVGSLRPYPELIEVARA